MGGVPRPESRVQVRPTTKEVVVQRFGLTSDRKIAPRPSAPVPSPKVNKAVFSRGRFSFQGTPSTAKLNDTSRRVGTAFARMRVPLRARSNSEHKWPKERVWGSLAASMPTFCLIAQLYSGDTERAERHEDHPPPNKESKRVKETCCNSSVAAVACSAEEKESKRVKETC